VWFEQITQMLNPILLKLEEISDFITQIFDEECPIENIPDLAETALKFKMDPLSMAIIALIAAADPVYGQTNDLYFISKLSKFTGKKRTPITSALQKLEQSNLIYLHPNDRYQFKRKLQRIIQSGNWDLLKDLVPNGIVPFLRNFIETVNSDEVEIYPRFQMMRSLDPPDNLFLEENEHLAMVKYYNNYLINFDLDEIAQQLFFMVIARKVLYYDSTDYYQALSGIRREDLKNFLVHYIVNEEWDPIKKGYFQFEGSDLVNEHIILEMTDLGVEQLLPELDPLIVEKLMDSTTVTVPHIKPEKINAVKLIFDPEAQQLLHPVKRLMELDIRDKISKKLSGHKTGVSVLLYGAPGTGKTEFCLQIAKEFDMPIFQVNVAEIQNKWVGESEKNIYRMFRQYNLLRKQTRKECILLFNEADAFLGKRVSVNSSVDNMENSLKNIFLEKMENFEGILFATSNLTGNLDPAFERRFLYKVFLKKPSKETAAKIWCSLFKGLPINEARILAQEFDFSPAEITNIKKKYEIDKILGSKIKRLPLIQSLCRNERILDQKSQTGKSLGF